MSQASQWKWPSSWASLRLSIDKFLAEAAGTRWLRRAQGGGLEAHQPRVCAVSRSTSLLLHPLYPFPLPFHRYSRQRSLWARVWRPAQPPDHLLSLLRGCGGAFFCSCVVCVRGSLLHCFGPCALVLWSQPVISGSILAYSARIEMSSCVLSSRVPLIGFDRVRSIACYRVRSACSDGRLCAGVDIIIYLVSSECFYKLSDIGGVRG